MPSGTKALPEPLLTKFYDAIWYLQAYELTHWGRVTHICISKFSILVSDNGLSPGRGQAIIWTNAGLLLIGPLGTHFHEILIKIHTFSFKKMHLKRSSGKWQPFCPGLNVLKRHSYVTWHHTICSIYDLQWHCICNWPHRDVDRLAFYIIMYEIRW